MSPPRPPTHHPKTPHLDPPPPANPPNSLACTVILSGHNIKKKQVSKTSIVELPKVKNCISRLCTNPLIDTPPWT